VTLSAVRRTLVSAVFAVAVALVALTWAIASPLGSSPDDNFHLNSIWCAWDRDATGCEVVGPDEDPRQQIVDVPALADAMPWCYQFQPTQSAACQGDPAALPDQVRSTANLSLYPPGYYSLMRLFVGPDTERSILLMRLVTAATSIAMLVGAALLFPQRQRWRIGLFATVALMPLGLFILASVNPSAWAVAATGSTFLAVLAVCLASTTRAAVVAAGAATGFVLLAASARADAALFTGIASIIAVVAGFRFTSVRWRRAALLAIPAAAVVVAYLVSARNVPEAQDGGLQGGSWQLLAVPGLYVGPGAQQLSFRDVTMPAASWVAVALALGMALAVGWRVLVSRRTVGLAVGVVALAGVPLYWQWLQGGSNPLGYVQPRYVLPATLTVVLLLGVDLPRDRIRARRDTLLIIAGLLAVANIAAMFKVLRRFTSGSEVVGWNLSEGLEWWWSWAPAPQVVWWVGGVAFFVAVVIMAVRGAGSPRSSSQARVEESAE
jgi:hypothetical protein